MLRRKSSKDLVFSLVVSDGGKVQNFHDLHDWQIQHLDSANQQHIAFLAGWRW